MARKDYARNQISVDLRAGGDPLSIITDAAQGWRGKRGREGLSVLYSPREQLMDGLRDVTDLGSPSLSLWQ